MPLSEAFCVEGQPILGGLFGVPKNEWTQDGTEVLRLIMDLRPINENFLPLGGDLSTLPVLSQMVQLEVHPSEGLIISSEDIRAMFYIIGVPPVWTPISFNLCTYHCPLCPILHLRVLLLPSQSLLWLQKLK